MEIVVDVGKEDNRGLCSLIEWKHTYLFPFWHVNHNFVPMFKSYKSIQKTNQGNKSVLVQ